MWGKLVLEDGTVLLAIQAGVRNDVTGDLATSAVCFGDEDGCQKQYVPDAAIVVRWAVRHF